MRLEFFGASDESRSVLMAAPPWWPVARVTRSVFDIDDKYMLVFTTGMARIFVWV
jgi:hypothetical protein